MCVCVCVWEGGGGGGGRSTDPCSLWLVHSRIIFHNSPNIIPHTFIHAVSSDIGTLRSVDRNSFSIPAM